MITASSLSSLFVQSIPLTLLLLFAVSFANFSTALSRTTILKRITLFLLIGQSIAGIVSCLFLSGPLVDRVLNSGEVVDRFEVLSLYFDRLSLAMFAFISFVGLAVYRFSFRYLEGDRYRNNFFFALGLAIASAQLLVLSGNLVLFALSWIIVSLALHLLLEHYPDRSRAILAARKKFLISRLGDLCLLGAISLVGWQFHSLDIASLFALIQGPLSDNDKFILEIAAFGIVGAAFCKSAQFPFHTWLPDTLEAPTPVSALMHAGIVNGGGYALIRFSPLFTYADAALTLAVIVGAVTAVLGLVVMWTQTTVKKSLAWSTVAQMGCMILQCGLGAYGLALMHLFGHGFYKAHAFLLSGTSSENIQPIVEVQSPVRSIISLGIGVSLTLALLFVSSSATGIGIDKWPGGVVSLVVLVLALAQVIVPRFTHVQSTIVLRTTLLIALLFLALLCETFAYSFFGESFAQVSLLSDRGTGGLLLSALLVVLFTLLAMFSCVIPLLNKSKYGVSLCTHAINGFYIGLYADRLVRILWPLPRSKNFTGNFQKL